jgi:hypothetical protein
MIVHLGPCPTQQFNLDETFGEVEVGSTIDGVIELKANMNQNAVYEFSVQVSECASWSQLLPAYDSQVL